MLERFFAIVFLILAYLAVSQQDFTDALIQEAILKDYRAFGRIR